MPHPKIIVRNLHFPHASVPRDWLPGRPAVARFFDQLSLIFPRGERFFIDSVRPYQEQLPPALREDVRRFAQQEALHGREHHEYNERLRAHGYPVDRVGAAIEDLVSGLSRWPARWQLAYTCAIEHFTAILGQLALRDDSMFAGGHPTMVALWRWHAVEENEHASVAYDVFHAVGGTYLERVLVMLYATFTFWAKVAWRQPAMQKVDGTHLSPAAYGQLLRFFFGKPGVLRKGFWPWLAYFRPSFHPRELDSAPFVAAWRTEFETDPLYLDTRRPKAA
jgi:predicted metal-dependent hydrolase